MYSNLEVEKLNNVKVILSKIKGECTVRINDGFDLNFRSREDLEYFIDEIQQVLVYSSKEAV